MRYSGQWAGAAQRLTERVKQWGGPGPHPARLRGWQVRLRARWAWQGYPWHD